MFFFKLSSNHRHNFVLQMSHLKIRVHMVLACMMTNQGVGAISCIDTTNEIVTVLAKKLALFACNKCLHSFNKIVSKNNNMFGVKIL